MVKAEQSPPFVEEVESDQAIISSLFFNLAQLSGIKDCYSTCAGPAQG